MLGEAPAFSGFAVDDIAAARDFYADTLGIKATDQAEMGPMMTLHLAGGRDTFVYEKPDFVPATYTILNFQVPDVEAAVDELAARGVTMERYEGFDQDGKGIARGMGPDIAWFKDPAGNILSILKQ